MTKIIIDTNVWLRFFLEDSPSRFIHCKKLFESVEEGKFQPYISNISLLEIIYTLKTFYRLSQKEIQEVVSGILKTRNIIIIEKTGSKKAIELHSRTKIKYADCLIATQIKPNLIIITYDRDFRKLAAKQTKTPEEIT